jgi:hypothetical protein
MPLDESSAGHHDAASVPVRVKSASHTLGSMPPKPAQWNTDSLVKRLGVDLASAMSAAAMICPVITVIDRYASQMPFFCIG